MKRFNIKASDDVQATSPVSIEPSITVSQPAPVAKLTKRDRDKEEIEEERRKLPIYAAKNNFLKLVKDNKVLIVEGETGCGKSTQVAQYLAEAGYASVARKIGCTQPRQIAAISIAKRVAGEYGCPLGQQVGYTTRFEDKTSSETIIKYMTDDMLLRECLLDANLMTYSVIILDDAHERSLHADILFGVVKKIIQHRTDLKLIIMSATLDSAKFSKFFLHAPIFKIKSRSHPVEIIYDHHCYLRDEPVDIHTILLRVMEIHRYEPTGDILVFLTGQNEIGKACEQLENMAGGLAHQLIIIPAYASLEALSQIFDETPRGKRKVIFATNIAEISPTVNGIVYVVDSGYVIENIYNPYFRMNQLVVTEISQAQADRRAGRAGRTRPGKCYRMYSEMKYRGFQKSKESDILKANLTNTVLQLKAIGLKYLATFELMDPLNKENVISACNELLSLGALDEHGDITPLGRQMAEFPIDPELSKMLIKSAELGCSEEVITIVAMLSVQAIFYVKNSDFDHLDGDHLTFLAVYNAWKNAGYDNEWCRQHGIQYQNLYKAFDIRHQLETIMQQHNLPMVPCGISLSNVRKALLQGYPRKVARKLPLEKGAYKTLDNEAVFIHPSSTLFTRQPECVVFHEIVTTNKPYMRRLTAIEPSWQEEFPASDFRFCDSDCIMV